MYTCTQQVASTLISIFVGGLITWLVAKAYYSRATQDLRRVAEELEQEVGKLRGLVAYYGGHPQRFP